MEHQQSSSIPLNRTADEATRFLLLDVLVDVLRDLPPPYAQEVLDYAKRLAEIKKCGPCQRNTATLSKRESEVLLLVANGYSRREIGGCLGISPNTAARHIANSYRKLDISTVAEATQYILSSGQ